MKTTGNKVIREMMGKYKWRLLGQTGIFAVLMIVMLTWEPIVLKEVFHVIELREAERLLMCGGLVGVGLIVQFVIGYFNNTYVDMDRWRMIYHECETALRKIPQLSYDEVNRRFSEGGIFERVFSFGQARMGVFANASGIGIYLLTGICLLANTWSVGIFFVVAMMVMFLLEMLLLKARSSLVVRYEKMYRKAEESSNTDANHIIQDLPFILMNHLEEQEIHDFLTIREKAFGILCRQKLWEAFFQGMDTCLTVCMKALLAVWMFPLMLGSGLITAVFATVDKMKMIVSAVTESVVGIQKMAVAVDRYEELAGCEPDPAADTDEPEILVSLSEAGIRLKDKVIFEHKNLQVKQGEKVAIVGTNGCGKSSVLKTVAGLYHLTEGSLCRKRGCKIAYIPAVDRLFDGTGEANITMSAAKKKAKPDFWFCNDFMEKSINKMSGGQRQRINIARGLYADADLLLADEPTSHLDKEASRQVMQSIVDHAQTCVVITHDRSLLDLFSRVIELEA